MLTFDVITLFPQLFEPFIKELPYKKALEKNLIKINLNNLRDNALDNHGTVDSRPFGGGAGMVLMIEPLFTTLQQIYSKYYKNKTNYIQTTGELNKIVPPKKDKIIVLTPTGEPWTQEKAKELANYNHITLISGRYEGIDERITQIADIEKISIGDYVLSGGELPALIIMESITRILPGVLEKEDAIKFESFENGQLEHPQYARPSNFKGLEVPKVLLSGHHKEIQKWKEENSPEFSTVPETQE
jgi:tRNA (guanine37-N1)-methyltransferase